MKTYGFYLPLLILLELSCSNRADNATDYQKIYKEHSTRLRVATAIYSESMRQLGKGYGQGIVTKDTLEQGRTVGKFVEVSLVAYREALAQYLEGKLNLAGLLEVALRAEESIFRLRRFLEANDVTTELGVEKLR